MIALTGASGFVGGRLLERLHADGEEVRALGRPEFDVTKPATIGPALAGADVAYYLIHAIGDPGTFAETEAEGARNFAAAARDEGVRRIVYLGGLAHGDELSDHMRSRQEVGRLLAATGVEVVELRASIVIGEGSLSWELVQTLVDNVPLLALPDWVDSKTQPVAIDDLVEYLVRARDVEAGIYEIGGADVFTYRELLAAYGDETGKATLSVTLPVLGSVPDLVADLLPEKARASLHLVESLRFDSTVRADHRDAFPITPLGVREAIRRALATPG